MSNEYRKAEYAMYSYPVNVMKYHELVLKIHDLSRSGDAHAQSYDLPGGSSTTHSNPPESLYMTLEDLRSKCDALEALTAPVERLRKFLALSNSENDRIRHIIMELYYFEHMSMKDLALHMQRSERTLTRRKSELVVMMAEELSKNGA